MQSALGLAVLVCTVILACLVGAVVPAADGWPPPTAGEPDDPTTAAEVLTGEGQSPAVDVDVDEHQTSLSRRRRRRRQKHHHNQRHGSKWDYDQIAIDPVSSSADVEVDVWTGSDHGQSTSHRDVHLDVDSGSHQRLPPSVPELQHLVTSLQSEFKESQATQMRTRSIINVMQEKQDRQQRDMAILKNDIVKLRRDLTTERELVQTLRSHAADASWAIADVKRGQDQAASDLTVLKRRQDLQNETTIVIQEIIMSNALELVSHNKHAVAVRHDIARLQAQVADDHEHLQELHDALQRHLVNTRNTNYHPIEVNSVEEGDVDNYDKDNVVPSSLELFASELHLKGDQSQPASPHAVDDDDNRHVIRAAPTNTKHRHSRLVTSLQERVNGVVDELAQLKTQVSTMIENHSRDGSTAAAAVGAELLQQAFVNFTRHIYQIEDDSRRRQHEVGGSEAGVTSSSEDTSSLESLRQRVFALNTSLTETRLKADDDRRRIDNTLANLRDVYSGWDERSRHLEIILLNSSLEHCRRANSELVVDVQLTQLSDKTTALDGKTTQLSSAVETVETGMEEVNSELQRHTDTLSLLSKQMKLLRHVPLEVATLHDDLLNIVAQFPPDCSEAMSSPTARDGVYIIRPRQSETRRTARVYCQRDVVDGTGWTVIQRRLDGRESFARGWEDYATGFGDVGGDYWLGNDYIHRLTSRRPVRLRVDMWDVHGRYWIAEYPAFRVASSDELYRLDLGRPPADEATEIHGEGEGAREKVSVGNATDALGYSDGQPFSAIDRDNDVSTTDCARFYAAGWWYKHCHYANLNGRYTAGIVWFNEERDEWLQMRQTVMKIAPVSMTTDVNHRRSDNKVSFETSQQQLVTDVTASGTPSGAVVPAG